MRIFSRSVVAYLFLVASACSIASDPNPRDALPNSPALATRSVTVPLTKDAATAAFRSTAYVHNAFVASSTQDGASLVVRFADAAAALRVALDGQTLRVSELATNVEVYRVVLDDVNGDLAPNESLTFAGHTFAVTPTTAPSDFAAFFAGHVRAPDGNVRDNFLYSAMAVTAWGRAALAAAPAPGSSGTGGGQVRPTALVPILLVVGIVITAGSVTYAAGVNWGAANLADAQRYCTDGAQNGTGPLADQILPRPGVVGVGQGDLDRISVPAGSMYMCSAAAGPNGPVPALGTTDDIRVGRCPAPGTPPPLDRLGRPTCGRTFSTQCSPATVNYDSGWFGWGGQRTINCGTICSIVDTPSGCVFPESRIRELQDAGRTPVQIAALLCGDPATMQRCAGPLAAALTAQAAAAPEAP